MCYVCVTACFGVTLSVYGKNCINSVGSHTRHQFIMLKKGHEAASLCEIKVRTSASMTTNKVE